MLAIKSGVIFLKNKLHVKIKNRAIAKYKISPKTTIKQYPKSTAKIEAEQNSSVKGLYFSPFIKNTFAPEVKIKVDNIVTPVIANLIGVGLSGDKIA